MSENTGSREMTLKEYCERLPINHRARRERRKLIDALMALYSCTPNSKQTHSALMNARTVLAEIGREEMEADND